MIDPYEFNDANAQGDKEAVILPNLPSLVNKLSADETNGIKDKINEIAQVVNVIDPDNANLQSVTNSGNVTDKEMIAVSDGLVPDDVFNQAVFSNKSFKAINTDTNNSITVLSDKIQSVKTDGGFESTINVSNAVPTETATYEHVKPNKSGTYAMTDDVGVATLQQATAGSNKNLVDGIFQAGEGAGNGQSGVNVNQFGNEAGKGNTANHQNALGIGAGENNSGNDVNQFGNGAGRDNTGNDQNALGPSSGENNSGNNVNQFGNGAGAGNTFNDVNLFGQSTQADEHGQTVFRSASGFMTRLSTLLLTASRKYILPDKSGTFAMLSDIGVSSSKNLGPTGLNQGGILTINTDTAKFDLSDGFGYVVNGHSDPDNPTYTKVTWVAKIANAIPNLATQKKTYVAVDINGDLFLTNVPLTATQRRNFIRIGVLIHLNNSAVNYIDNQPTINIEIGGQVQDILEALGFKSLSGNRIFPVSNNLKIKKELGRVFKSGANFDNLTTQPHSFTLAAQEPITFRYRTQTGDEGSDITDITPAIYDLNGTITAVAATATLATIQRVYIFQDGVIRIQPGQRVFTTLNAAITALNSDVFVTDLDIAENSLYLGAIVLTRNTVDLSNISQAIFAPSIGTTANGSVTSPALGYTAEDVANKQNNLAVDGTGAKYPTVDAVNAVLDLKVDKASGERLINATEITKLDGLQNLVAGTNITIVGDVISASGGGGGGSFVKLIVGDSVESAAVTGTIAEVIAKSYTIPAGAFSATLNPRFTFYAQKGVSTAGTFTASIYLSNTNNFATAILTGFYTTASGIIRGVSVERITQRFIGANLFSKVSVTNLVSDNGLTANNGTTFAIDQSQIIYVWITLQNNNVADSTSIGIVKITD